MTKGTEDDELLGKSPRSDGILASIRKELKSLRTHPAHHVADLALVGFAFDVIEQATAVHLLHGSQMPRAAFANARAAFEASQDILMLVSDENDYDRKGCLACVFQIHDDLELGKRINEVRRAGGHASAGYSDLDEMVATQVESWNAIAPGRGRILSEALSEFKLRKGRAKQSWLGTRKEIDREVASFLGDAALEHLYDAMYGALSAAAHPRIRLGERRMHYFDDDLGHLVGLPLDKEVLASMAFGACGATLIALKQRQGFFKDLPAPDVTST